MVALRLFILKMAKERLCNKGIHGPHGALLTLKNIDFERIRDFGLQTMVVLYLSQNRVGDSFTAKYDGPVVLKENSHKAYSLTDLALPQPKYQWLVPDELQNRIEKEGLMPASALFGQPNRLEFKVSATCPLGYEGLLAFRDILIPALFENGYDQHNASHTSAFWLHAGRSNPWEGQFLCIDPHDGLSINRTEVNGFKVFTEMDVKKLLNLEMSKKDYK